jgi:hypothetical protein
MSKDHRGMPVPCPFVTFASFCSNFFAYFCPPTLKPLWGDHPATPTIKRYRSNRSFSKDHRGMPIPSPLLPLLPSVQISLLTSVRRQRPFVSRQKDIEEICTTAFSRKVVGG